MFDNQMTFVTDSAGVVLAQNVVLGVSAVGFLLYPLLQRVQYGEKRDFHPIRHGCFRDVLRLSYRAAYIQSEYFDCRCSFIPASGDSGKQNSLRSGRCFQGRKASCRLCGNGVCNGDFPAISQ